MGTAKIFAILGILVILGGGIGYLMNLKANLAISEENNKKLIGIVEEQKKTFQSMQNQIKDIQTINSVLVTNNQSQEDEIRKLNERFEIKANGESRDFGKITRAKPNIVRKIVNKGTENSNRCFELMTGATLQEGEKNAECQEFINSLSK